MPPPKVQYDLVPRPAYLVLYEGLAYEVSIAYSCGQWTMWVELPQAKPHNWPADSDLPVPNIVIDWKGNSPRNGIEELRRNIDGWIRAERPFKGEVPKPLTDEQRAEIQRLRDEQSRQQMVLISPASKTLPASADAEPIEVRADGYAQAPVKRGPGRPPKAAPVQP